MQKQGIDCAAQCNCTVPVCAYTDKKENKMFLIYKEIQMGSGANSYMRKGFLMYKEMHKYFHHIRGGR